MHLLQERELTGIYCFYTVLCCVMTLCASLFTPMNTGCIRGFGSREQAS